jgi:hypothetical protein
MKLRAIVIVSLVGLTAVIGGCGTAATEIVGLATGGKGTFTPIQSISTNLGAYQQFELGTITDDMGGKVPPAFFAAMQQEFSGELREQKIPNTPSGKAVLVRGRILHYEGSSSIGMLTGAVEFVVARIEMVDKDTGQVLGTANCVGSTKTRGTRGVGSKADGLAEAIVKWIEQHYPEDQRIK